MHDTDTPLPVATDIGAFCRAVEAHLCRVNAGHLVRIVGPAFELVAGWAREGMPLRVVLHGIDRTIARLTAKGPRRRPVRIEFCEADVRDAADQWRRAVGAAAATPLPGASRPDAPADARGPRLPSLPRHLERVLVRLSSLAATHELPPLLARAIAATIHDVDACLNASRGARQGARTAIVERLAVIDNAMTHAAVTALPEAHRRDLMEQVRTELSPYRGQLPAVAMQDAEQALLDQLTRRHFSLPQVRIDG